MPLMTSDYLVLDRGAIDQPRTGREVDYVEVVYVCEDLSGSVLYVGASVNWWERRTEHRRTSPWWQAVARVHLLREPNVRRRRTAERDLISIYQPPNNRQGTHEYRAVVSSQVRAADAARARRPT